MHVIATAGHVDHGKSTLVRRLTGMEPDRWAEERRRGLTIGLGFAWTTIGGTEFAFVDVPGHERFVGTMMAGVGPVPAVMFVVAADGGWMPQSAEHLAVLDALRVRHGLLVITRADLADPRPALRQAREHIRRTSLGDIPSVIVSPDRDLGELKERLTGLDLPHPDPAADVRLWVDRSFTIDGAGTVVTGTLAAGTISVGDELVLGSRTVHVKGLHSLGRQVPSASGVARVAVNLRGLDRSAIRRGDALLTPSVWARTALADVRLTSSELPGSLVLHIGSAAVPVHVRPLGTHAARLRLSVPLPLRIGDRVVLRDPGRHEIAAGADVLDIDPPPLHRRGDARRRGADLGSAADLTMFHLTQKGFLRPEHLRVLGLPEPDLPTAGGWYIAADRTAAVKSAVDGWDPLRPMPVEALRQRLGLPDVALAAAFAERAGFTVHEGHVDTGDRLPARVRRAVDQVVAHLRETPFRPPDADRLRDLGLGRREIAAAVRTGALIRLAGNVVLLPDAPGRAAKILTGVPFTPASAGQALDSTRRVVIPLLERLDALGVTEHRPDGTRVICETSDQ
ncbi:SelB C-terminal domain-containing protein [Kibdelosporangium persicum]|uniref:Selenocysteine-specific translation elongation factor SelB n=1 Tax=Kibdelosporangium persicum TaxID=2698649 RepID=A0ABX2FDI2_9PSEU|nr:SelB C-terminal domain-containing protein [Kibdelosporangium persicum]NRN68878.1 Selenocysteine-specific translation elongation factor SelB [Kibdelosporangium persicum]